MRAACAAGLNRTAESRQMTAGSQFRLDEKQGHVIHYNTERPHLGYRNMGRRPIDTVISFVSQEG